MGKHYPRPESVLKVYAMAPHMAWPTFVKQCTVATDAAELKRQGFKPPVKPQGRRKKK